MKVFLSVAFILLTIVNKVYAETSTSSQSGAMIATPSSFDTMEILRSSNWNHEERGVWDRVAKKLVVTSPTLDEFHMQLQTLKAHMTNHNEHPKHLITLAKALMKKYGATTASWRLEQIIRRHFFKEEDRRLAKELQLEILLSWKHKQISVAKVFYNMEKTMQPYSTVLSSPKTSVLNKYIKLLNQEDETLLKYMLQAIGGETKVAEALALESTNPIEKELVFQLKNEMINDWLEKNLEPRLVLEKLFPDKDLDTGIYSIVYWRGKRQMLATYIERYNERYRCDKSLILLLTSEMSASNVAVPLSKLKELQRSNGPATDLLNELYSEWMKKGMLPKDVYYELNIPWMAGFDEDRLKVLNEYIEKRNERYNDGETLLGTVTDLFPDRIVAISLWHQESDNKQVISALRTAQFSDWLRRDTPVTPYNINDMIFSDLNTPIVDFIVSKYRDFYNDPRNH